MSIQPITNVTCAINLSDINRNEELQWTANFEGLAAVTTPQKIKVKNAVLSFVVPKDSLIMIIPQIFAVFTSGVSNNTDFILVSTEKGATTEFKSSRPYTSLKLVLTNVLEVNNIVDTQYVILDYRSIDELDMTLSTSIVTGKFQAWNYNFVQNNTVAFPLDLFVWDPTGTVSTPSLKYLRANAFQITKRTLANNIIFSFLVERTS